MQIIPNVEENDTNLKKMAVSLALLVKWIIFGLLTGVIAGLCGAVFCKMLEFAASFRAGNSWTIFILPLAGLVIVSLYHFFKDYNDTGANLIISAITKDEAIPLFKAPLIVISTFLTHICGGSSGREGAALQLGGSLGYNLGRLLGMDDNDKKMMTMTGMAAAFSALFGTPMAAAFFAIELSSVGAMHYAALVPTVGASLTASSIAAYMGVASDAFMVKIVPELNTGYASLAALLAVLGALMSIVFCLSIKGGRKTLDKYISNPYVKVVAGGIIIIVLSMIFRSGYYNGTGIAVIEMAFKGEAPPWAFILKLLFTSITLGAGYKGGEIVPALYVGATFGSLFAQITGFPLQLATAMGMVSVFCGATNCPVASLLIAFEMFGFEGMPYYLITISLSYAISGYISLYGAQVIKYSKFRYR
ncbi:chloride channel protein [Butyrivibrio sp. MC2013]|uniref:chloride channel protein n=1 Tax=Butyrivibrio sp. MC2013 TaxID=1280686 RepID=UPI00041D939B|nr:chloride channel protein [Butyrivibrio sp. MC2013]